MSKPIKIAPTDQILPGQSRLFRVQKQEIVVYNVDGTFYATANQCPHSRGPLSKGRLSGSTVTCPWHGAKFDVTTGECLTAPATTNVTIYPISIEDGTIFVRLQ